MSVKDFLERVGATRRVAPTGWHQRLAGLIGCAAAHPTWRAMPATLLAVQAFGKLGSAGGYATSAPAEVPLASTDLNPSARWQ